jgi:DNA-directed RNA polymerase
MIAFEGGYVLTRQALLRSGANQHTASAPEGVPQTMIDAVNHVQATAWRINSWILDTMRETWLTSNGLALPASLDDKLPDPVDDDEWHAMGPKERGAIKHERSAIHESNARLQAKRGSLLRKLDIAECYREEDRIYFPHFMDFRGRIYPMCQDLNPQADDIGKGLLHFADGKRLGAAGVYWLAVHLANSFGENKITFAERVAWVLEHEPEIFDSARDPLDGRRFWAEADEPWAFLAACREWSLSQAGGGLGHQMDFISHLPVSLDGTCNGLQHLALAGGDRVGAKATNCVAGELKQDFYQTIAHVVGETLQADAQKGTLEALAWVAGGGVERATVKRACMTVSYGVTSRGIRTQLISDGFLKPIEGPIRDNVAYMQEAISQALSTTMSSAMLIMTFFQNLAGALADANIPLRWVTPAGMTCIQSYWGLGEYRVKTLKGRLRYPIEDEELKLRRQKQILASAPNIVHSWDAAMLAETTLRCAARGITHFAMIHDSYGVHATDVEHLRGILCRVAKDQYARDRVLELYEYAKSYAPHVALPTPPARGDLDIEAHGPDASTYFFA